MKRLIGRLCLTILLLAIFVPLLWSLGTWFWSWPFEVKLVASIFGSAYLLVIGAMWGFGLLDD